MPNFLNFKFGLSLWNNNSPPLAEAQTVLGNQTRGQSNLTKSASLYNGFPKF